MGPTSKKRGYPALTTPKLSGIAPPHPTNDGALKNSDQKPCRRPPDKAPHSHLRETDILPHYMTIRRINPTPTATSALSTNLAQCPRKIVSGAQLFRH